MTSTINTISTFQGVLPNVMKNARVEITTSSLAAGTDTTISIGDVVTAFQASYTGTPLVVFPDGLPRPVQSWSSYALIMWRADNSVYSVHAVGSGSQQFIQTFMVLYV